MRIGIAPWLFAACVVLAGCGAGNDVDVAEDEGAGDRDAATAGQDGPCVSYYADSDEVAGRGRLVQLDISLDFRATRDGRMGSGDTSMVLEAQSQVEGTASQLACAWDMGHGGVRYELVRAGGDDVAPFAHRHAGRARLSGHRVMQADGATVREEVDVAGALEDLRVVDMGLWEGPGTEGCVVLAFDAPLRGRSLRRIAAPGVQREEPMAPSELVLDGYSALSPRTYSGGDHRFLDQSFAICTGEEGSGPGQYGPPGGLTISDDGLVWQRSGRWQRHPSGKSEQRTVDFTLRVVPPSLRQD